MLPATLLLYWMFDFTSPPRESKSGEKLQFCFKRRKVSRPQSFREQLKNNAFLKKKKKKKGVIRITTDVSHRV